ncbi:MAG: hypothetical protein H6737_05570 [Alphaproteobacteria bacterium]|nr:hypothetical protein [Alphaproteobacteria bacterium]
MTWLALFACTAPPAGPPPETPVQTPDPAPEVAPVPVEPLPASGAFVREVAPGLVVSAFDPPEVSGTFSQPAADALAATDRRLFVVTIDPAQYDLAYLSSLEPGARTSATTGTGWADAHGAHVVWNPGMFEPSERATGYTRAGSFASQPAVRRNAMYGWFFTVTDGRPAVLNRQPPGSEGKYVPYDAFPAPDRAAFDAASIVSQSLSIVRDGEPVYPPRKNQWSELAYGVDDQGRTLVVFSRYPYEMRELGARVAALGIGARDLLHGEGGPEATLVVKAGGVELIAVGSYETGFYDDSNHEQWALPAVMAAIPRGTGGE